MIYRTNSRTIILESHINVLVTMIWLLFLYPQGKIGRKKSGHFGHILLKS